MFYLILAKRISRATHCVYFPMITKNVIQDTIPKDFRNYLERLIVPVKDATKTKELSKTNKAFYWYSSLMELFDHRNKLITYFLL